MKNCYSRFLLYFSFCFESERVRVDFLTANATAHKVTTTTATATKMRPVLLNSGTVGLGDTDVLEESERTDIVSLSSVTNISPLPES
jgi:hypothetical protein